MLTETTRKRMNEWRFTDEELQNLLEYVSSNDLVYESKKFFVKEYAKNISYGEVLDLFSKQYYPAEIYDLLVSEFKELPNHFQRVRTELKTLFRRFLINKEELTNFINDVEKELGTLRKEVEYRDNIIKGLQFQNKAIRDAFSDSLRQFGIKTELPSANIEPVKIEQIEEKPKKTKKEETKQDDDVIEDDSADFEEFDT